MTNSSKIRVLIVDDSATIRSALKIMIRREDDMEVIGTAPNGAEGLRMAVEEKPDVILMDIEMPVMTGIEATRRIMEVNPVPILIFSSLAEESAPLTLEALDSGAVDFVLKDTTSSSAIDIGEIKKVLIDKIRAFCKKREGDTRPAVARTIVRNRKRLEARTSKLYTLPEKETPSSEDAKSPDALTIRPGSLIRKRDGTMGMNRKHMVETTRIMKQDMPRTTPRLVAIGASTGGPQALTTLMRCLPPNIRVPIVIAQHMPASFVAPFAKRLSDAGPLEVKVAENGQELRPGTITIAPGGYHMEINKRAGMLYAKLRKEDLPGILHKPSVDVLFDSVAEELGGAALAMILTGMGRDGADGAKRLHDLGALVMAQDESSSVVYGMPRAVVESGSADAVLPIEEMGETLAHFLGIG